MKVDPNAQASRESAVHTHATELVAMLRGLRLASDEHAHAQLVAASMAMPGGGLRDPDLASCVGGLLDCVSLLIPIHRANSTWRTYGSV